MSNTMFIGRWAPFHDGHKYIVDSYVNTGKPVVIAVRDTPLSEKDPFSAELRKSRIEQIYKGNTLVSVIIIPDIDTVSVGRGVGYSLTVTPDEIKSISGTKEREKKDQNTFSDHEGGLIWFTGLPCSGKTTIAKEAKAKFESAGYTVEHLDGDVVRKSLSADLGFSEKDRETNLKRVAAVAEKLVNHGVIVLATFVSPSAKVRNEIKQMFGNKYKEIFVNCPVEECERRDVKGMWAKARSGDIKEFTGVSAPYDIPISPDIIVNTETESVDRCVEKILDKIT